MAKFTLRYSPLFYEDLDSIVDYLLFELKNEQAARALVADVETAIMQRLKNPLSTASYRSISPRQHAYRRITIGNYLIFYVVIDNTMIVRRMLYGPADLDRILS